MLSISCFLELLLWVLTLYIIYKAVDYLYRLPTIGDLADRYVLITGCDTGFGHLAAIRLDAMGCHVFAGCLTEHGEDELKKKCSSKIIPFHLDVRDHQNVCNAAKFIEGKLPQGKGLHGLVNNAGIMPACMGPTEWMVVEDFKQVDAVNLYGLVDVTLAVLPLIKRARGRIVNTTSAAGLFAMMEMASYTCSKYAVEAFSDSIRRELQVWGCSVHIVEPGGHKTAMATPEEMAEKYQRPWDRLSQGMRDAYGRTYVENCKDHMFKAASKGAGDPKNVADAYVHALTAKNPRSRYLVGFDAKFIFYPLSRIPECIGDRVIQLIMATGRPRPSAVIGGSDERNNLRWDW